MDELISISIMTYNQEKYIQDTLESVIKQDYDNLELVIIDDNSTDSTISKILEMMERLKSRFVRVKIIVNEHNTGNMSKNSNILLNEYRGSYFKILGGDDLLTPDSCRKSMEYIKEREYKTDVVFSDVYIIDELFKYCSSNVETYKVLRNEDIREDELIEKLLLENRFICIGALCNTKAVKDVGGYDESVIVEDYQMWTNLAIHGGCFGVIHEPLAMYRRTGTAISNVEEWSKCYVDKYIKLLYQTILTNLLFKTNCCSDNIKYAVLYKIVWALIEQYSISVKVEKAIEKLIEDTGICFDVSDIKEALLEYFRTFAKKHKKFLVYGYGKYGKRIVTFFDKHGIRYECIVDKGGNTLSDKYHEVKNLDELHYGVDCALITPKNFNEEIRQDLRQRGIYNTDNLMGVIEDFVNKYCNN